MGRLVLALLLALAMLAAPVAGPAAAHGMAGDCPVHAAAAAQHAGDGTGHQRHAPAPKALAAAACCLLVSLSVGAGHPVLADRRSDRDGVPVFADDVAQGRIVEPAEPPPRSAFLPRA